MTGATVTFTEIVPAMGLKIVYFTVTLDGSAKADFSQFATTYYVKAVDDATPWATDEAVTAITQAGDVTFTNNNNAIRGWAIVQE